MSYIFFDTETTGLDDDDRIIQLSYIITDKKLNILGARNYFFDVDEISVGATAIHGIDKEKIVKLSGGKRFEDYAKDVLVLIKDMPLNQRIIPLGCIPNKMDEHANRRAYTQAMYFRFARPISDIPKSERYYCRQDAKGLVLDRKAMAQVSLYLGHGSIDRKTGDYIPRVNVIASSYII